MKSILQLEEDPTQILTIDDVSLLLKIGVLDLAIHVELESLILEVIATQLLQALGEKVIVVLISVEEEPDGLEFEVLLFV